MSLPSTKSPTHSGENFIVPTYSIACASIAGSSRTSRAPSVAQMCVLRGDRSKSAKPFTGRMDVDSFTRGGIDFSPYQPIPVIRMVLCESELRDIQEHRFERFFRVWCTEKATYAPCLKELVILLRPSFEREPGSGRTGLRVKMEGIHAFLDYFNRHVSRDIRAMTLKIYVDSWCESRDMQIHYANAPQPVFESSPGTESTCSL